MSLHTVNVSNISPSTTEAGLKEYFALCGKIASIHYLEKEHKATIAFEKRNATQTALMLNDAQLDGATLSVTSDLVHHDEHHRSATEESYEQSDKPRAGIAAEYLAKGYILSDHILERAIEMDNKQGISKRFLSYFHSLDKSVGEHTLGPDQTISGKLHTTVGKAVHHAKTVDEEKGYSKTVHGYYVKAVSSHLGQRVRAFYTDTSKQVQDIHEEARRIADHDKNEKLSASKHTTEGIGSASEPAPVSKQTTQGTSTASSTSEPAPVSKKTTQGSSTAGSASEPAPVRKQTTEGTSAASSVSEPAPGRKQTTQGIPTSASEPAPVN